MCVCFAVCPLFHWRGGSFLVDPQQLHAGGLTKAARTHTHKGLRSRPIPSPIAINCLVDSSSEARANSLGCAATLPAKPNRLVARSCAAAVAVQPSTNCRLGTHAATTMNQIMKCSELETSVF